MTDDATARWVPAPDCDVVHAYGEEGWRPAADGTHEHRCTCRWAYKSPGILYGISMMKQWLRLETAPDCPVHAPHVIGPDGRCTQRGHHHV